MKEDDIVENTYDLIAEQYYKHRDLEKFNTELDRLIRLLPKHAQVLDVGCGAGIPTAKYLTEHNIRVIGIDVSSKMLELARKNVPEAKFLKMNMKKLDFEPESFDGVISVYALFHVAKKYHKAIFAQFHGLLRSNGILVINTGIRGSENFSSFFGHTMFWSNYSPTVTLKLIKNLGFKVLFEGILRRGGELQYWIFAQKSI